MPNLCLFCILYTRQKDLMVCVNSSAMNILHANRRFNYSVRCPHIGSDDCNGSEACLDCVQQGYNSSFCHCILERFLNIPVDPFEIPFLRKNSPSEMFTFHQPRCANLGRWQTLEPVKTARLKFREEHISSQQLAANR